MIKTILYLAAIGLATITCFPYPYQEQNGIISLGAPTFQVALNEFPHGVFVYFYEPSSLLCREFDSEYIRVGKALKDKTRGRVAKLDCFEDTAFCEAMGVTSYPTFILYRGPRPSHEYKGLRTSAEIQTWYSQIVDGYYKTYVHEEELFKRFSIAILVSKATTGIREAYQELFDYIDIVNAGDFLEELDGAAGAIVTQSGTIMKITEADSADRIKNRINALYYEKAEVQTLNEVDLNILRGSEDQDYVLYFRTKKYDPTSPTVKAFTNVAKAKQTPELRFAYVNVVYDVFGKKVADWFGIKEKDDTTFAILSKKGRVIRKYKTFEDEISETSINELIDDFQKGEAVRYYMSAAPVKTNKYHSVRELVGSNFEKATGDPTKNVLVMFYTPLCQWCAKLDPLWKMMAYRFRNFNNLVFAKIDMSQNDIEGFNLDEFPIVVFYLTGDEKKPVEFLSERTLESFTNFLSKYIPAIGEIEL